MGIVNVTPDSFSDGGHYFDPQRAVDHALQLVADGADILDIGGESTRPYSQAVKASEELERVIPVVEALVRQTSVPISIDTSKALVARSALDSGAQIINDVTGLEGDRQMIDVARDFRAAVCAMHMQGTPQTMQDAPHYENVVEEIYRYLDQRRDWLLEQGIGASRICLDPGIGFGKTHAHNIELLRNIARFNELRSPILVGHSRKGFIASILDNKQVERDSGTLGVSLHLAMSGVQVIRIHNVGLHSRAWRLWQAVRNDV
ncbi:MAG: dihydropteroate synthase [Planctomycetaceae bacterium]|nr:dihydropteroate synthase [Planctomycetaceae bacterium]